MDVSDYGDKIMDEVSTYIKALEAQSESLRKENNNIRDENKRLLKKDELRFDENCKLKAENERLKHERNVERCHEREDKIFLDNIPWDDFWVGAMVKDNHHLTARVAKCEEENRTMEAAIRKQVLDELKDRVSRMHTIKDDLLQQIEFLGA